MRISILKTLLLASLLQVSPSFMSNLLAQSSLPDGFPDIGLVSLGGDRYDSVVGTFTLDAERGNRIVHDVLGPLTWEYSESIKELRLDTDWWGVLKTSVQADNSPIGYAFPYVLSELQNNTFYYVDVSGSNPTPFWNHALDGSGRMIGWQSYIGVKLSDAAGFYAAAEGQTYQMQVKVAELQSLKQQMAATSSGDVSGLSNLRSLAMDAFAGMDAAYQTYVFYFRRVAQSWIFAEQDGLTEAQVQLAKAYSGILLNTLHPLTLSVYGQGQVVLYDEIEALYAQKSAEGAASGGGSVGLSFSNITSISGNTGGHGVMWADINNDNLPDAYYPLNDRNNIAIVADKLLVNQGNGQFSEQARARGVADVDEGSHGAAWCDLDNDGDFDLVNGSTYGGNNYINLFSNDGTGHFSEVVVPAIQSRRELTRGLLACDLDSDGDLDLFGVPRFKETDGGFNEIYINQGGFTFTSHTQGDLYTSQACQGAIDTDFDNDGDVDIIAANFSGNTVILRNNGSMDFSRVDPGSIGLNHGATEGISSADIDNDGDLDLLLSISRPKQAFLYRNDGTGVFTHAFTVPETLGYMGGFADLDNDGDLDLYCSGDQFFYENDGRGNYSVASALIPVNVPQRDPRAVSFADIDNDGDLDFSIGTKKANTDPIVRNDLNSTNRWLKVKLVSPEGQLGAFGAKTYVYSTGAAGRALLGMRESKSNYGYLAQDDPTLHFGLGRNATVDVEVQFLTGKRVVLRNVSANQTLSVDGR